MKIICNHSVINSRQIANLTKIYHRNVHSQSKTSAQNIYLYDVWISDEFQVEKTACLRPSRGSVNRYQSRPTLDAIQRRLASVWFERRRDACLRVFAVRAQFLFRGKYSQPKMLSDRKRNNKHTDTIVTVYDFSDISKVNFAFQNGKKMSCQRRRL